MIIDELLSLKTSHMQTFDEYKKIQIAIDRGGTFTGKQGLN